MNMLKRFLRNDNADLQEDENYEDVYMMPEDLKMEMADDDSAEVSAVGESAARAADLTPATPDKVEIKLLKPKSHIEASTIADKLT